MASSQLWVRHRRVLAKAGRVVQSVAKGRRWILQPSILDRAPVRHLVIGMPSGTQQTNWLHSQSMHQALKLAIRATTALVRLPVTTQLH